MNPDVVIEMLRNLYAASGGDIPPTAYMSALSGLMWNDAWMQVSQPGVDETERAFNERFARTMGWTQAEFDRFVEDLRVEDLRLRIDS